MDYNIEDTKTHVRKQFSNTNVEKTHMHFMSIDNLFPDDFYKYVMTLELTEAQRLAHDILCDEHIVKTLYKKFVDAELRSDVIRSVYAFWQRSGAGYSLKPHVDSYPRVFTVIVNLADSNEHPNIGTAMYSVDDQIKQYTTNAVAPYVMNSASVIAPNDHTWHGVNLIENPVDRKSIVVVFSAQEWNDDQIHYSEWKSGSTVNYVK